MKRFKNSLAEYQWLLKYGRVIACGNAVPGILPGVVYRTTTGLPADYYVLDEDESGKKRTAYIDVASQRLSCPVISTHLKLDYYYITYRMDEKILHETVILSRRFRRSSKILSVLKTFVPFGAEVKKIEHAINSCVIYHNMGSAGNRLEIEETGKKETIYKGE